MHANAKGIVEECDIEIHYRNIEFLIQQQINRLCQKAGESILVLCHTSPV